MKSNQPRRCPACRDGTLQQATRERCFLPHGKSVRVELLTSRCSGCGNEVTSAAQHDENLARLKARKSNYDGLLLGEEILALRRRYGITQQQASLLFGKGKIAFSRYETETTYPDASTTLLLTLALEKIDVMRWLADKAGIELPLWPARCKDERKTKLRVLPVIEKTDARTSGWVKCSQGEASQSRINARMFVQLGGCITESRVSTNAVNEHRFDSESQSA